MRKQLSYIPSTIDYTVSTTSITQLKKFLSDKIPAYYAYPVSDWEFFNKLQKAGVSDIIISGPIAFSMETLFRQKQSTKIRVLLSHNPYSLLDSSITPDSFYIRPEDTKYYTAIDYIEFPIEKEEILFSIYKNEEFLAEISYLVPNITPDIKNALLPEDFAKRRLNCGRRCDTSGSCHYCEAQFKIAELIWKMFGEENDNRNN